MSSEQLILEAGDAIAEWAHRHTGPCVLSVKDGIVVATKPAENAHRYNACLFITHFAQNTGLTAGRWYIVGKKLLNLYNKEKACQEHQKH